METKKFYFHIFDNTIVKYLLVNLRESIFKEYRRRNIYFFLYSFFQILKKYIK